MSLVYVGLFSCLFVLVVRAGWEGGEGTEGQEESRG
jgi:hypothetical protein